MRQLLLIFLLLPMRLLAQTQPEISQQLRSRYAVKNGIDATVTIHIEIPGITAPGKTVEVHIENGKAPKIKGAGLIIIPKKGLIDNFSSLLSGKVQWIETGSPGDYRIFKVVSLDPGSDWITADLTVNMKEIRIDETELVTRESGTFLMHHFYGTGNYPDRTEITFSTDKFSIPLKFLGKPAPSAGEASGGKVKGKVTLEFISLRVF